MSSSARGALLSALLAALAWALSPGAAAQAQQRYPGVGRPATPKELAAWDIDVRPDFKGLPKGSGSVAQGMEVWEAKCASCHGIFGESNQVFSPLVGGTTAQDIETGRVARLLDPAYPGRTTLMKLATLSTLWDYISRAMPWDAPKSLKPDEVYAVTAFVLNLGGIVPDDLVLSDRNIAEVQKRLPNRHGMNTDHGLWPGRPAGQGGLGNGGRPELRVAACMRDCAGVPRLASVLPDFARNAHGNLAEQNRAVGEQHGVDTTRPPGARPAAAGTAPAAVAPPQPAPAAPGAPGAVGAVGAVGAAALASRHLCLGCHAIDSQRVGPAFRDVASRYAGRSDVVAYLAARIRDGGSGNWGAIAMPPQTLAEADARILAQWLAQGAPP